MNKYYNPSTLLSELLDNNNYYNKTTQNVNFALSINDLPTNNTTSTNYELSNMNAQISEEKMHALSGLELRRRASHMNEQLEKELKQVSYCVPKFTVFNLFFHNSTVLSDKFFLSVNYFNIFLIVMLDPSYSLYSFCILCRTLQ